MAVIVPETIDIASDKMPLIKEGHIPSGHMLYDHIERCIYQSHCVETEVTSQ